MGSLTTGPLGYQAGVNLSLSFPLALAAAIGLEPGEEVQWELLNRGELHLVRPNTPPVSARSKSRKS